MINLEDTSSKSGFWYPLRSNNKARAYFGSRSRSFTYWWILLRNCFLAWGKPICTWWVGKEKKNIDDYQMLHSADDRERMIWIMTVTQWHQDIKHHSNQERILPLRSLRSGKRDQGVSCHPNILTDEELPWLLQASNEPYQQNCENAGKVRVRKCKKLIKNKEVHHMHDIQLKLS